MADLGFKDRHVAALLDGSKPFTLRRAWRNGRTPDIGARIGLVSGWRTPQRRKFATALVEFRCEVLFDEDGITAFNDWRTTDLVSPAAERVHGALRKGAGEFEAVLPLGRFTGRDTLAFLDGFRTGEADQFGDWRAFYAFHNAHRAEGSDPVIRRELIGLGLVTAEFAA